MVKCFLESGSEFVGFAEEAQKDDRSPNKLNFTIVCKYFQLTFCNSASYEGLRLDSCREENECPTVLKSDL